MCPRCAGALLERTAQHLTKLYPICRYGLLASVLADHRDDFDLFLSFYNHYENTQGLMCWQQVQIEQEFFCALQLQPLHVDRPVACYSELVTSKQTHSSGQHTHTNHRYFVKARYSPIQTQMPMPQAPLLMATWMQHMRCY